MIFFENRDGRTGCLRSGLQSSSAVVDRLLPDCSVESLKRDLEMLLAGHGLYPKEAEAMVKTWEDSWFEEGLRVFYVLPRRQTDAILPLAITPKPNKLVRVLVGRMEIMTPEAAQEIFRLLTRLKTDARMPECRSFRGPTALRQVFGAHDSESSRETPGPLGPCTRKLSGSLGLPAREGHLPK